MWEFEVSIHLILTTTTIDTLRPIYMVGWPFMESSINPEMLSYLRSLKETTGKYFLVRNGSMEEFIVAVMQKEVKCANSLSLLIMWRSIKMLLYQILRFRLLDPQNQRRVTIVNFGQILKLPLQISPFPTLQTTDWWVKTCLTISILFERILIATCLNQLLKSNSIYLTLLTSATKQPINGQMLWVLQPLIS